MSSPAEANAWARVRASSERIAWDLDGVLPGDASFDFGRPFLPETLTGGSALPFLSAGERLMLGQLRAYGYLGLFGIVEEAILPFVTSQVGQAQLSDLEPVRALLGFASEEAKHIALFRRFSRTFERGFVGSPRLVGPAEALARAVLGHNELGVALAILHIEWMTQSHWLESARGDESLEPAFKRLLHAHWLEEAQHARLDALLVAELSSRASSIQREDGLSDYLHIVQLLDAALAEQVALDCGALQDAIGRRLSPREQGEFRQAQHASQRATFLLAGMRHPRFLEGARALGEDAVAQILSSAQALE